MHDMIIVGGGIAGLTTGIYAGSRGLKALVIEKAECGGVIGKVSVISHFPGINQGEDGAAFINRTLQQLDDEHIPVVQETVISYNFKEKIKKITTDKNVYETKTVILAQGTTANDIGILGEKEFLGNGVSHCAKKDIKNYENGTVVIVGGSDGAVKECLFLAKHAKYVHLVHFEDTLGAIPEFKNQVEQSKNIQIHLHSRLHSIEGKNHVEKITIKDEHTESFSEIKADPLGVFIYIGSHPNTETIPAEIKLENGFIVTDEKMMTNIAGVFAVGDIRHKTVRQVSTAANDGTIAAISATAYIKTLQ